LDRRRLGHQEDLVTDSRPSLYPELTRPGGAGPAGQLDEALYDLVEARFERLLRDNPILATSIGIHEHDDELGDGSVDALLSEVEADKAHLGMVESLDPAALSAEARFERELEIHNLRASTFDAEEVRIWERRSVALDTIGDGLFLLFARDHAPLAERLQAIAGRLEGVPAFLQQARTRARAPQVRLWQKIEIETAGHLPAFLDEIVAAAERAVDERDLRRLERAVEGAKIAIAEYRGWLHDTLADGSDDWAVGRERHDQLVVHRAFDGFDSDAILELGWDKLAEEKAARVAAAREIDPDADEAAAVDRVKSDHPASFAAALDAYRDAMLRARQHLIDHDLVSIPEGERIEVVETPEYLRNVIPFAAYFEPAKFDRTQKGIYVVTPSVGDNATAMREHNYASISNTSIHEAYPGHHLQLTVASRQPSLTRLLTDAAEFVEGWGMYTELMMREHGFDDDPRFRLILHTDAIWRACRVILDVRLHRGELTIDEATRFLVENTSFEEPNARAEVQWYTYRPTYPMSYLLGRTLLLGLRADEQRRLGDRFSLRRFHDTLLRNGSLPISFHRRLLAADAGA
jgi:uncharacterized protein (DUF885 family)